MRATLLYGAGDVRVENILDAAIKNPTDAVVRVLVACICGSDLHPYRGAWPVGDQPLPMGHEFVGVIEDLGADVQGFARGDVVIVPMMAVDNTCQFCRDGLSSSCEHVELFGFGPGTEGTQAEAVRVPLALGTMVKAPVTEDSPLLPSLLTLSDVFCTGHHAAVKAGVSPRTTVTVIGDGAVGLLAVLAAKRLGAEQIILMGRHEDRTSLGREFGVTDVVAERGEEGIARAREIAGGFGTHTVLEAVGSQDSYDTAIGVVRPGGTISRVGLPSYDSPIGLPVFGPNVTVTGGPAPVRAYVEQLLPDVLDGSIQPGRVFDQTLPLADAADGYQAMDDRSALKVLLRP